MSIACDRSEARANSNSCNKNRKRGVFFLAHGPTGVLTIWDWMAENALSKFWSIKQSIRHVASEFIELNPDFKELILSYCKEIDYLSKSEARRRLQTLSTRLG
jgi:hypothetical protein